MYIKQKEIDAVQAALDFIAHNADSAVDKVYYEDLMDNLRSLFKKGVRDLMLRERKQLKNKTNKG